MNFIVSIGAIRSENYEPEIVISVDSASLTDRVTDCKSGTGIAKGEISAHTSVAEGYIFARICPCDGSRCICTCRNIQYCTPFCWTKDLCSCRNSVCDCKIIQHIVIDIRVRGQTNLVDNGLINSWCHRERRKNPNFIYTPLQIRGFERNICLRVELLQNSHRM